MSGSAAARGQVLQAQRRVDHRVRPAGGVGVVAEVDERVAPRRAPERSAGRRRSRASLGQGAADEQPAQVARRRTALGGRAPRPATGTGRRGRAGAAPPRSPAVRSGWPATEQRQLDRGGRGRRRTSRSRRPPRRPGAWRPARSARRRGPRPGGAAPRGWPARRPRRTGRGRRRRARSATPTPAWSSSASTCWQPVPDAATIPTGPGDTTLAKPSPRPPTTAVPQSGPITSSPRSAAARLSASSCSTGTLSLKTITSWPASSASIASTNAVRAGHRHQRDASGPDGERAARSPWSAAAPPRSARLLAAAGARRRAASTPASARVQVAVVVEPDRDDHVVGPGSGRDRRSPSRRAPRR